MSDQFDHTLKHKPESKPNAAIDPVVDVRRIALITGGSQRRRWSSDDKARIVRESLKPGANVSDVARQHGLRPHQLYRWRREARALIGRSTGPVDRARPLGLRRIAPNSAGKTAAASPAFAPVVMAMPAAPLRPPACETSLVEIAIGEVSVRVRGLVDVGALVAVLSAVRRVS